jgi:hypothetical protein
LIHSTYIDKYVIQVAKDDQGQYIVSEQDKATWTAYTGQPYDAPLVDHSPFSIHCVHCLQLISVPCGKLPGLAE